RGEGGLELAPPLSGRAADGRRADGRRRRGPHPAARGRCARRLARARGVPCPGLEGGGLKGGPQGPGSEPGPVCYGRGGTEPTVTDANVVLGYLNPDYFAGGAMRLDVEAPHAALTEFG